MEARATDAIEPHGGKLTERLVFTTTRKESIKINSLTVGPREASDLEMLGIGGYSPLTGFLGEADYRSVCDFGRLASGQPWTIPITLSAAATEATHFGLGEPIALCDSSGEVLATLHLQEKFSYDKKAEARSVYRTDDAAHPGVAALYRQGEVLLAGPVDVHALPRHHDFVPQRLKPADTRRIFRERGWRRIVGFQTRNPIHRAHEYIQKVAMEVVDGLLLHPLVGETKGDDVPATVRMRCYEALLERYYPKDRVLLAVNPAAMRYAGPREAIFHAIIRKNYGCTHFIVGRDHAGVGNYYGTYDAHRIFDDYRPDELGITPLFFEHTFWCRRCGAMASTKTCPHAEADRVSLSGTKVREMLTRGEKPPPEFSRPEVAEILIEAMHRSLDD
jgi:sulfate adenylyltransferase